MADSFKEFERIVRAAYRFTETEPVSESLLHPFERRNIHSSLPVKVKNLFDNGHYDEAALTAWKFLDRLTPMATASEIDEQKGYRFVFAGSVWAIRNPRGHEIAMSDDIDTCLDHLSFASMLIRRLERAGFVF